jgi:hypothetical protein
MFPQESTVADLVVQLRERAAPGSLRDSLARALGDPTLEVAYWLPESARYADATGQPVSLPADEGDRAVTPVERGGVRVAALIHDPGLRENPELLQAVVAAAGLALENERLQAELRAKLEELRASRADRAGRRQRAASAGAKPPPRRPAAAARALILARVWPSQSLPTARRPRRNSRATPNGRWPRRSRSYASSPAGSIRRS